MEEGWLVVVILAVIFGCCAAVAILGRKLRQRPGHEDDVDLEIFFGIVAFFVGAASVVAGILRGVQGKYRNLDDGKECTYEFQCKSGSTCTKLNASRTYACERKEMPSALTASATTNVTTTVTAR